jgi:hypothetical protein
MFMAVALAATFAVSSCGGPAKTSSSPTTAGAAAPTTAAPAAPTTAAPAAPPTTPAAPATTAPRAGSATTLPGGTGSLGKIESAAEAGSKATFKLTYSSVSDGSTTTITLEQALPNQLFRSGSGEVLVTKGKTYYCDTTSSPATCTIYGSASSNPLASLMGIYDGSTYIGIMKEWQSLVGSGITGYHLSVTSASYAGQPSQCAKWEYQGTSTQYCFTDKGLLAYVGTASSNIKLTGYSSSVASTDFAVPAGATVVTLP